MDAGGWNFLKSRMKMADNPTLEKERISKQLRVMADFLFYLNRNTDQFILKGGTALLFGYGLNRFSEDIDLDCTRQDIKEIVRRYANAKGYSYSVTKDTEAVSRCMLKFDPTLNPLKIEVSYRKKEIPEEDWTLVEGIRVYKIDNLAQMKSLAYAARDKIRDLFDLSFICNNFYDDLSKPTKNMMKEMISYKGLEQFDYIVQTQHDPLIDNDKLLDSFLKMHEKLGVLAESRETKDKQDQKER